MDEDVRDLNGAADGQKPASDHSSFFTLHSSFIGRWRHRDKLVFRVWPMYKETHRAIVTRKEIPIDGFMATKDGRMVAMYHSKEVRECAFEVKDEDMELMAAAAMSFPAKRLFGSESEWQAYPPADRPPEGPATGGAVEAKCKRAPMTKKEREERRQRIKEQYGFDIWTPVKKLTPEELEGRKRWLRDEEAEYRKLHREHITLYNREYRQRKRAEALAVKQKTWTAEEWEKWRAKEEAKGRGKPERFVKDVVKLLAESGKISEDQVMDHLLEHGGVEFLMSGAEAIGKDRAKRPSMVKAAAMAVAFYIDPDGAVMFPDEGA